MVYDFGSLTNGGNGSARSLSSSDAEFELEDRPVLRGRMRNMPSPSPRTQRGRLRSVSASRTTSSSIVDLSNKNMNEQYGSEIGLLDSYNSADKSNNNIVVSTKTIDGINEARPQTNQSAEVVSPDSTSVTNSSDKNLSSSLHRWIKTNNSDKKSNRRNFESPLRSTKKDDTVGPETESPPKSPRQFSLSPMKSARRFWSNRIGVADSNSLALDIQHDSVDAPSSPVHEMTKTSSVSPIKVCSQRVIGTILGSRQQNAEDKNEPNVEVPESVPHASTDKKESESTSRTQRTFGTVLRSWHQKENKKDPTPAETTNADSESINLTQQSIMTPPRRVVSGILRVRSSHDRTNQTKQLSIVSGDICTMHKSQSLHGNSNSPHNIQEKKTHVENCTQLNIDEMVRGETGITSNSERGTRSSVPLDSNNIDTAHSRTVKSLVSPRREKTKKLKVPSRRESENGDKCRDVKLRRRSGNASVASRSSRSIGGTSKASSMPRNQLRRSSHSMRSNSMPKSRDSTAIGRSKSTSRSRSQSRPSIGVVDNKSADRASAQSETLRTMSSDSTPKTPRSTKGRDHNEIRSRISNSQLTDQQKSPRLRKESDKSICSSHRGASNTKAPNQTPDRPKTPRSIKSGSSRGVGTNTRITRSNLNELQSPHLDDTATPQNRTSKNNDDIHSSSSSRRCGQNLSSNKERRHQSSKSDEQSELLDSPNSSKESEERREMIRPTSANDVCTKKENDAKMKSERSKLNRSSSNGRRSISSRSSRNDLKSESRSISVRSSHSFNHNAPSRRTTDVADTPRSAQKVPIEAS